MPVITGYHAHVYYDGATMEQARILCERARDELGIAMGHMHERRVGPHPAWSCQLSFPPDRLAEVVPWLMLNRNGLTVFTHAETGDDLKDHTDHTIWMGSMPALDLSIFRQ